MKHVRIAALMAISLFVTSCGGTTDTTPTEDTANVEDTKEEVVDPNKEISDEVNIAIRPIKSFNPLTNVDAHNKEVLKLIYDELFFYDENMRNTSNIVDEPIFSEDGKSVTLTVKSDAKWHNGLPIRAEDIVYSISTLLNNQNPLYVTNLQGVTEARVVGGNAVIYFNKIVNMDTLDLSVPIVQKDFYTKSTGFDYENLKTNGTGKFKLVEAKDSRNFELKILDRYSDTANIDKINLLVIEDFETEINAFNADIIDLITMSPEELTSVRNSENTTIINVPTNEYEFIAFNFKNPLLNDVTLRQALAYVIPTDETIKSMFLNSSDRTQSNVNPNSYLYSDSLVSYTEDFEKSKELLGKIGFNGLSQEGLIEKKTETSSVILDFTILVNEDNVHRTNIAKKYSENLKAVGIKSTVLAVPYEEYTQRLNEGRYDIAFVGYLTPEGQNNIALFGANNILNYSNAKIPEISERLKNAKTSQEYKEIMFSFQNIINTDLPVVSICYNNKLLISNDEVSNINVVFDNYFYNIDSWQVLKIKGTYEY